MQTGVAYNISSVANATYYLWTLPSGATIVSGDSTSSITVDYADTAQTGNITVTPFNSCGSGAASTVFIEVDTVQSQSICIVTVDTTSTKNFLIWEKPITTSIDSFRIYREIASAYTKIGSVSYNSVSEFIDNTNGVNPNTTAYKYEISSIDSCGNESALSPFHRTMLLQVGPASPPNSYNLSWNDYVVIPVTQYVIMRDSSFTGWSAIDSVSFGNPAWTDIRTYLPTDTISYYIRIDYPNGCVSSIKNPQSLATNLNTSRSNVYKVDSSSVTQVHNINSESMINIYPNPTTGNLGIEIKNIEFSRGN